MSVPLTATQNSTVKKAQLQSTTLQHKNTQVTTRQVVSQQSNTDNVDPSASLTGFGIGFLILFLIWIFNKKTKSDAAKYKTQKLESWKEEMSNYKTIPIQVPIFLNADEKAFKMEEGSYLSEPRSVRYSQGGFGSIRIARGIRIGSSSGVSASTQEWQKLAKGTLILTNKRLFFSGGAEHRSIPLTKIESSKWYTNEIFEITLATKNKPMRFWVKNPLLWSYLLGKFRQDDKYTIGELHSEEKRVSPLSPAGYYQFFKTNQNTKNEITNQLNKTTSLIMSDKTQEAIENVEKCKKMAEGLLQNVNDFGVLSINKNVHSAFQKTVEKLVLKIEEFEDIIKQNSDLIVLKTKIVAIRYDDMIEAEKEIGLEFQKLSEILKSVKPLQDRVSIRDKNEF